MNAKEMTVWIFGIALLFALLVSPVACTMNRQRSIAEAIKAGADPVAAKCAIEGDQGYSPDCILNAAQRQK